ncbi:Ig-like domain-containing protein [Massilia sp. B-10]|nr:Ig-like domain-containing protein [Massilia sp. B-10]
MADTVSATSNQETTFKVLANDSHPDNLALELVSVGAAAHGTAALKNGALVYTPAAAITARTRSAIRCAPWVAR